MSSNTKYKTSPVYLEITLFLPPGEVDLVFGQSRASHSNKGRAHQNIVVIRFHPGAFHFELRGSKFIWFAIKSKMVLLGTQTRTNTPPGGAGTRGSGRRFARRKTCVKRGGVEC